MYLRPRRPLACLLAIGLILAATYGTRPAVGRTDDDVFTSESHGFRIERPAASWAFFPQNDPSTQALTLALGPATLGGAVRMTVVATPMADPGDPSELVKQSLEWARGKPEVRKAESAKMRVAGRMTPGIRVEMEAPTGGWYELRQFYVVEEGMRYTLACHAPVGEFSSHASAFDRTWKSLRLMPISDAFREERALLELAARCGSEIDWAETWDEAARRARDEKKLVMAVARFIPGFNLTDQATTGPLMDSDVVELVRERFVPVRLTKEMESPLRSRERYGMSGSTFGQSFLITTPDGEVIRETPSTEATSVYAILLEALGRRPEFTGAAVFEVADGDDLVRAERLLRRGDLEGAGKLLENATTARGHRLRASLYRRMREGGKALLEIERARKAAGASNGMASAVAVDEATILVRLGRYDDAQILLERIVKEDPKHDRSPEALYRLGACRLHTTGTDAAETPWRTLVRTHPDSRWAWKAAADLSGTSFALGRGDRLNWLPPAVMDSLRDPAMDTLGVSQARRAERDAVTYLLERQRPDGSWTSPAEVGRFREEEPVEFTDAITAICARSLLPLRKDSAASMAMTKAVDFLHASRDRAKRFGERTFFMDYSVWSKAYVLWFLVDCRAAGFADHPETMKELISELREKQKKGGGWSYYVTGDLSGEIVPANQSISFTTAAVTLSLLRAREVGIRVPEEMMSGALGCLERMRNENGTFEYMLHHANEGAPRRTGHAGAAGRGPLCALALLRGGRGSLDEIRATLDTFLLHRQSYANEQGKALMHAGDAGQGSHYLLFDYAIAAEAARELPEKDRSHYRTPLLELILAARSVEGGYLDNPILGWDYGTGMAVHAFRMLAPLP